MINWLAGQLLGKEFKALVCDSGIFSTKTFASATDEGWFPSHDFEGYWWAEWKKSIEKWDSSSFVDNWTTPMMIVHNEKDFRHPITEGVAAFNVSQERKIESAFLTFEDEGDMAVQPENMLVLYKEIFRFLNPFVGIEGSGPD
jgi:dipeptidyl aminopeptidase/acylaminoacyl peptidase